MKRALIVCLALAVVWVIIAFVAGPRLLEAAYRGESLSILNDALSGRSIHPLSRYMDMWWSLVIKATVALAVAGGLYVLAALFWPSLSRLFARTALAGRLIGPGRIIACAAALGVSAGMLEVIVWQIRLALDGFSVQWSNIDTIWAAPLLMAVFATVVALPFAAIALRTRPGLNARLVLTVVGLFCWYGLLRSMRSGIHPFAVLVLAAGLAVATGNLLIGRGIVFLPRFGRRVGTTVGAVVVLGMTMVGARAVGERLDRSSLPDAAGEVANVIVIIWDTVRAESLGIYGYPRATTPELARMAEGGLVFDEAIVSAPWTLPSHASMFTGLLPAEHGADWQTPLSEEPATLAEFLRDRGYATGGFVANLEYTSKATGLARGFAHYDDYGMDFRSLVGSLWWGGHLSLQLADLTSSSRYWRKNALEVTREALDWIDRTDRPFFIFMNYYDAHGPYELHPEFTGVLDQPVRDTVPGESSGWVERDAMMVDARDKYDTSLAFLDNQIGWFHDELDRRGLLDNTLIVISSDHGEMFGEHGLEGHAKSLYDPVLRVPLLMVGPRLRRTPGRVSETAPLTDLPATIVDWLGLGEHPFGGQSLLELGTAHDDDAGSRFAISQVTPNPWVEPEGPISLGPAAGVSWNDQRLIRYGDGSEAFFDLRTDPAEVRDLSGEAELGDIRSMLGRQLDRALSTAATNGRRETTSDGGAEIASTRSTRNR